MTQNPDSRIPITCLPGAAALPAWLGAGGPAAVLTEAPSPVRLGAVAMEGFEARPAHRFGCGCCAGRSAAAVALDRLFQGRARGRSPWFDRVGGGGRQPRRTSAAGRGAARGRPDPGAVPHRVAPRSGARRPQGTETPCDMPAPNIGFQRPPGLWWGGLEGQSPPTFTLQVPAGSAPRPSVDVTRDCRSASPFASATPSFPAPRASRTCRSRCSRRASVGLDVQRVVDHLDQADQHGGVLGAAPGGSCGTWRRTAPHRSCGAGTARRPRRAATPRWAGIAR